MTMYVVGHKIPDSDSICGALAIAYLKNQIKFDLISNNKKKKLVKQELTIKII